MDRLSISLLGLPNFELGGIPLKPRIRKNIALLAYLSVTKQSYSRDSLILLLWPDLEPKLARAGLRRNLSILKKSLKGKHIIIERDSIRLDQNSGIWLDVDLFKTLIYSWKDHGHMQQEVCPDCLVSLKKADKLYRGDFMAGFGLPDTPDFDEWQYFNQNELQQDMASAFERLTLGYKKLGDHQLAIKYARRWSNLDRFNEMIQRHLMVLYALSNQYAAALRQYMDFKRILKEELNLSPEIETIELYESIKDKRNLGAIIIEPEVSPIQPAASVTFLPESENDQMLAKRYIINEEIGRGGTGIVYLAIDSLLDREVAIKIVHTGRLGLTEGKRLLAEARAVAKLNHPNIISVFDAGESLGISYIVMERFKGVSLADCKPDTFEEIIAIAIQICDALEYAHSQGVVHRDLKPENVVLSSDGTVKLTDFGLARPVSSRITSEGRIAGTVFYLAPEVVLGKKFDGRADLYALGIMLYELTTRRLPFIDPDPVSVITQHIHTPVVPPRAIEPSIPAGFEILIIKLLNKNPDDRPNSAGEVIQLLSSPEILEQSEVDGSEISVLKRIGRGRLVGRNFELDTARELWMRVFSNRGQVLLISGEPGVGKTRLVREIITQVQVTSGSAINAACYTEGGMPYYPFIQILRQGIEIWPGKIPDSIDSVLSLLYAQLPEFQLPFQAAEPGVNSYDPEVEKHRLFENLTAFYTKLSERKPLLMVIEDIHWADSGTLHLLRHLARSTQRSRIMIVSTFRDVIPVEAQVFQEMLLNLTREEIATHIKLQRLDREQSKEMLGNLLTEEINPEFLDGIYGETEGNPFYIEEVCKALVESGKLYFQDGRWHRPSVEELGIPRNVKIAIEARVRVLPKDTQETLLLAAVLGRKFDLATLAHASEMNQDIILERLELAELAQLIETIKENGRESFIFAHALIAATLVEGTRATLRRKLNKRAANALEIFHPDDFEALAHRYLEGGDFEKAANYYLKAGDRARRLYAHQEAIKNYNQVLKILKETGDLECAARTQMKLGLTYHNAFDFKSSRQAYQTGFVFWQKFADEKDNILDNLADAPHALRLNAVEPANIEQGLSMGLPGHILFDQLFSGLVEVSPDMSLVPNIASSWNVLEGGRKYIFHLRNDVFWSDGVQVTAQDFEYTWKRILNPGTKLRWDIYLFDIKNAAPYHKGDIKDPDLVGVRALDKCTLAVDMEGPTSYFPYLLAFVDSFPVPAHVFKKHGKDWSNIKNIATNGPFQLVSWKQNESLTMVRNPTFHGRFSGNINKIEWSFFPNQPEKILDMYENGNLDLISGLPPIDLASARQRFAEEYISGPWMNTDFISFDVTQPPFNDRRVRIAFAMATDREMLADVILRGYAFPAAGGLIPPQMPGHSPTISIPHDPMRARQLLARAGYNEGRGFPTIKCLSRDEPGHDLACEYLQAEWLENLGIEIEWEQIKWVDFYNKIADSEAHMWMTGWYADYPDPDDVLRLNWWIKFSGWQNEAFNTLVDKARQVMDQEERMSLYHQADKLIIEEAIFIPLLYGRFHMMVKPWVKNVSSSPLKWWTWKDVVIEPH